MSKAWVCLMVLGLTGISNGVKRFKMKEVMMTNKVTNIAIVVLITAVMMLPKQSAYALIYNNTNLLQNASFENHGNWIYSAGATNSTTKPRTGSFSLELVRVDYWQWANQTVTIFRNRTYYYSAKFASNDKYVSPNQMYIDGVLLFSLPSYTSGGWKSGHGSYKIPGSGEDDVVLQVLSGIDLGEIGYWDDIYLNMEYSAPVVTSNSLDGNVAFSTETVFNIYNNGGIHTNNYSINFDPDITINAASNINSVSITWLSDTNAQVTINPSVAGPLTLTITNERSESSYGFSVNVATPMGTIVIIQ